MAVILSKSKDEPLTECLHFDKLDITFCEIIRLNLTLYLKFATQLKLIKYN